MVMQILLSGFWIFLPSLPYFVDYEELNTFQKDALLFIPPIPKTTMFLVEQLTVFIAKIV